jgi:hypothetical protein
MERTNMKKLITVSLFCLLIPFFLFAEPLTIKDLSGKKAFKTMSFKKFLDNRYMGNYPFEVTIPRIYKARNIGYDDSEIYWVTKADYKLLKNDKAHSGDFGFFKTKITMNVGYDQSSGKFFSRSGEGIAIIAEAYNSDGFENMSGKRHDQKGVPLAVITGTHPEGGRTNMIYVATGIDTNVIFIYYRRSNEWSDADELIWNTFLDSLLSKTKS